MTLPELSSLSTSHPEGNLPFLPLYRYKEQELNNKSSLLFCYALWSQQYLNFDFSQADEYKINILAEQSTQLTYAVQRFDERNTAIKLTFDQEDDPSAITKTEVRVFFDMKIATELDLFLDKTHLPPIELYQVPKDFITEKDQSAVKRGLHDLKHMHDNLRNSLYSAQHGGIDKETSELISSQMQAIYFITLYTFAELKPEDESKLVKVENLEIADLLEASQVYLQSQLSLGGADYKVEGLDLARGFKERHKNLRFRAKKRSIRGLMLNVAANEKGFLYDQRDERWSERQDEPRIVIISYAILHRVSGNSIQTAKLVNINPEEVFLEWRIEDQAIGFPPENIKSQDFEEGVSGHEGEGRGLHHTIEDLRKDGATVILENYNYDKSANPDPSREGARFRVRFPICKL